MFTFFEITNGIVFFLFGMGEVICLLLRGSVTGEGGAVNVVPL